jgi:glycosyltransferase involved in cell wall biosynthesis
VAYLKPGRNGFMVPRNDLASLKERILFLLDHDDVRAEFSRHAREDILREASIEGMFSGFKQCVDYLTARSVHTRLARKALSVPVLPNR